MRAIIKKDKETNQEEEKENKKSMQLFWELKNTFKELKEELSKKDEMLEDNELV